MDASPNPDRNDRIVTQRFQRGAATAVGALVCLVVILAILTAPDQRERPLFTVPEVRAPLAENAPGFQFEAENILSLIVVGLVSGTFGSMLGMGGGVLRMSFLLLFFGFHPGVSRFAALLSYFVVAAGASYQYLKLRFVMKDVVAVLIPSGIAGIFLGAIIGSTLPKGAMTILLGVFLLFIAVLMMKKILSSDLDVLPPTGPMPSGRENAGPSRGGLPSLNPPTWIIFLCGFPGGFLSAMLGVSGGVITNPLQQVLARIPIKNAIANTLVKASVTVPIACLMIMILGIRAGQFDFWTPLKVALCILPGSVIGSQLGPALTRKMSPLSVHALFGAVALVLGINMLFFG
ncbi:MAG: sulfite exporter TauE/SafE family protein [Planctomycetota bacterium]